MPITAEEMPEYVTKLANKHSATIVLGIFQSTDKDVEKSKAQGGVCVAVATKWIHSHRTQSYKDFGTLFKKGIDGSLIERQLLIENERDTTKSKVDELKRKHLGLELQNKDILESATKVKSDALTLQKQKKEEPPTGLKWVFVTVINTIQPLPTEKEVIERYSVIQQKQKRVEEEMTFNGEQIKQLGQKLKNHRIRLCGGGGMESVAEEKDNAVLLKTLQGALANQGCFLLEFFPTKDTGTSGHAVAFHVGSSIGFVDANSCEFTFSSGLKGLLGFLQQYWQDVYHDHYKGGRFLLYRFL